MQFIFLLSLFIVPFNFRFDDVCRSTPLCTSLSKQTGGLFFFHNSVFIYYDGVSISCLILHLWNSSSYFALLSQRWLWFWWNWCIECFHLYIYKYNISHQMSANRLICQKRKENTCNHNDDNKYRNHSIKAWCFWMANFSY